MKMQISLCLAVLFLLMNSAAISAQNPIPTNEKTGRFEYESVVKVDSSLLKEQLFTNAFHWFALNYKSANDVIQQKDKDAGIIVGKGNYKFVGFARTIYVNHTIVLKFKDGRYKYTIGNFDCTETGANAKFDLEKYPVTLLNKKSFYIKFDKRVQATIESLKEALNKQPETGEEDW